MPLSRENGAAGWKAVLARSGQRRRVRETQERTARGWPRGGLVRRKKKEESHHWPFRFPVDRPPACSAVSEPALPRAGWTRARRARRFASTAGTGRPTSPWGRCRRGGGSGRSGRGVGAAPRPAARSAERRPLLACTPRSRVLTLTDAYDSIAARTKEAARRDGSPPGPAQEVISPMLRQSPTRTVARSTSALAEFHDLAGHAGPADGCEDCQAQQQRQRGSAAALRSHQRQTRQQIDAVLDSDLGDEQ